MFDAVEEHDAEATWRRQVEEMPRLRFVCEHDWIRGPNDYAVGFLWDRKMDAVPGEFVYRKRFLIRLKFKLWLERWK